MLILRIGFRGIMDVISLLGVPTGFVTCCCIRVVCVWKQCAYSVKTSSYPDHAFRYGGNVWLAQRRLSCLQPHSVYIYSIGSHHLLQNQSGRTHPTAIIQEPIRTLHGRRIGIHWPWSEGPPVNRIGGLDFDTTTTLRVSVLCQKELHITHIGLS